MVGPLNELEIPTPTGIQLPPDTDECLPALDRFTRTSIPMDSAFIAVGVQHVLAVSSDRKLLSSCGSNDEFQLGLSEYAGEPRMINIEDFSLDEKTTICRVETSDTCTFVQLSDGTLWAFGTLRVSAILFDFRTDFQRYSRKGAPGSASRPRCL